MTRPIRWWSVRAPPRRRSARRARPVGADAARSGRAHPAVPRDPDLRMLPRRGPGGDPSAAHAGARAADPPGRGRAASDSVRLADLHAGVPGGPDVRRPRRRPGLRVPRQADGHLPVVPAAVGRGGRGGRPRRAGAGHRPRRPHLRVCVRGRGRRHGPHLRPRPSAPLVLGAGRRPGADRAVPGGGVAGREDVGRLAVGAPRLARGRAPGLQPGPPRERRSAGCSRSS